MELHVVPDLARCHCFGVTLKRTALHWFRKLPAGSITTWSQLEIKFLRNFQAARQFSVSISRLANVRQGDNESLKSYLHRFTTELLSVNSVSEDGVLCLLITGVKTETKFWKELQETDSQSLSAFYMMAEKHLRREASIVMLKSPATKG